MALPARLREQLSRSDIMSLPVGLNPMAGTTVFDDREINADLRWPYGIEVWEQMRHDPQVHGLLQAVKLPIRKAMRKFKGDDVRAEIIEALEAELGTAPQPKGRRRRRTEGVNISSFLDEMLTTLIYGHTVFEQVYEPGPPMPGQENAKLKTMAHIRKLAYVHPRIIRDWHIDQFGSLQGIKADSLQPATFMPHWVYLPIDTLVVFNQNKIGANWWGESMLRPLYKPWYLKDTAERIGAMAVERAGLGIPHVEYGPGGNLAEARQIGMQLRAGETAHVATQLGQYVINMIGMGADGKTVDTGPTIERNNQAMSKAWLAQVMDLGHSVGLGSGNMSETFLEMFCDGINAIAQGFAETITEHIIRDYVELNWGEDEPYPEFQFAPVTPTIAGETLSSLVSAGLITPDEDMESMLRDRYSLPELKPGARAKHAADQAAQQADAAKQMNEAVPQQQGPGGGDAGPKGPASPRPPSGTWNASGSYDVSALRDFDESKHPRAPKGSHEGGKWTKGGYAAGGLAPITPDGEEGTGMTMSSFPEKIQAKIVERFTDRIAAPEVAEKNLLDVADEAMANPDKAMRDAAFYHDEHAWGAAAARRFNIPEDTFFASVAALSPGCAWKNNKTRAEQVAHDMNPKDPYVLDEDIATRVNTRLALDDGVKTTDFRVKAGMTILEVAENSQRAAGIALANHNKMGVRTYDPIESAVRVYCDGPDSLRGPKPRSFSNNLQFPTADNGDVTVDVWHWRSMAIGTAKGADFDAGLQRTEDNPSSYTGYPKYKNTVVGTYPLAADITRKALVKFNTKYKMSLTVADFQALVWGHMRDLHPIGVIRKANASA